jgi:hypothetical protein
MERLNELNPKKAMSLYNRTDGRYTHEQVETELAALTVELHSQSTAQPTSDGKAGARG